MGCQKVIADKIWQRGAGCVLSVKEKRPALYEAIKEYLEED
jgi:predicted transposase YbfD/YdcC